MGGGPAEEQVLILLPIPEPRALLSSLRRHFPTVDFHYKQIQRSQTLHPSAWHGTTFLYTLFTFPEPSQAPKLRWIHLASAGSDHVQKLPIFTKTDIVVTTSSGIHGPQIAEWCIMTLLAHYHKYKLLHERQMNHDWNSNGLTDVRDMVKKTVGILGYGSIGRQVGRVAKAMGMDVLAFTATEKDTDGKKKDHGFILPGTGDPDGNIPSKWYSGLDKQSLQHFLSQNLDWLVISVPLTKETRHFLSGPEFKLLKGAFVTNIARGPIIDQPALVQALKDGQLAGAALDTTEPEPLPKDSELWDFPNVIVTPHVSGSGVDYMDRAFQVFTENLGRNLKGKKLLNVVDRRRGY
ncbi:D-3-phosphoglycerate dehydrogenase [Piedraia hortae CBS 480.64]|uniref:D-3-phosphoglycerate dehydrogenase n=1 Tax=Piedraia hortae CBS 480.64 TaxID=1314780 RepID=A0A6A7BVK5_9PEZI|nr:D-3-phosphoglycerate dehydrogenase [Piedraia hortae CBS 480.64]